MTQETKQTVPVFTFEFDLNEANAILAALQELPGKICNPISEKLKAQAQVQIAELEANTTPAPEAE